MTPRTPREEREAGIGEVVCLRCGERVDRDFAEDHADAHDAEERAAEELLADPPPKAKP